MVSTSNDGMMTEYLVTYLALRRSGEARPAQLLETLHITDCYRAGRDLRAARDAYDMAMWNDVPPPQIKAKLNDLERFMAALARDRAKMWNVAL